MTRQRTKELLPVMQAFAEGRDIQSSATGLKWTDSPSPNFEIEAALWRIKPVSRDFWVNVYPWNMAVYGTEDKAMQNRDNTCTETIHVREVIE